MKSILRNTLAVILGLVGGSIVNMALIMVSSHVIPIPDGADNSSMEGLKASMHLFGPQHFIFPFLAHALGTLTGAWIAVRLAVSHHLIFAMAISGLFLLGGITNVFLLPSPVWFNILDVVIAYLPMGYLGWKLGK